MKQKKIIIWIVTVALAVTLLGTAAVAIKRNFVNVSASNEDDSMDGDVINNPWASLLTTKEITTIPETTEESFYYDVSEFKSGDTYTYPTRPGCVFAGWYTDETCETVYTGTTGVAYAKFVSEKILSVKFQWKNDKTAIRFLSTMDHTNYQGVGFIINGTYGTGTITNKERPVTKLFASIVAANQKVYPTVFSGDSTYFFVYTVREMDPSLPSSWSITPYWITPDGTKVTGVTNTHTKN